MFIVYPIQLYTDTKTATYLFSNKYHTMVCISLLGHDAMEVARDIVATITDPRSMVGPEVRSTLYL